jgi:hypothetical protein
MRLDRNQIKNDAINDQKLDDLQITNAKIAANANIQQSKIQNLVSDLDSKVDKAGDTLTGYLTLSHDPILPMEIATKQYIDNLSPNNSVSSIGILPTIAVFATKATVGVGSLIHDSGLTQNISSPIDIPFNSANIENNASISNFTDYYLYATGIGFIWSDTAPSGYKIHPTEGWLYLAWSQTSASGTLLPLKKHGSVVTYTLRQLMFSLPGPHPLSLINLGRITPPFFGVQVTATFAIGISGTTSGQITTFTNPLSPTETSNMFYYSWNGSQTGYTYNNMHATIPLYLDHQVFYYSQVGSATVSCYITGYLEN